MTDSITNDVLARGELEGSVFCVTTPISQIAISPSLWHARFGHLSVQQLQQATWDSLVEGLPMLRSLKGVNLGFLEVQVGGIVFHPRLEDDGRKGARITGQCFAQTEGVIKGDIMGMELPEFDLCVANIPYKISSPLTFKLLSCTSRYRAAVMMLQREFARRLMATTGDPLFCRLSVNTQLLASISILMEVNKANFSPPPKVDSTIVCISPHSSPPPVDLQEWNSFIRVCFSRKNKTLGAIFRQKHILSTLAGHFSQGFSGPEEDNRDDMECKDFAGDCSQKEDQEVELRNNKEGFSQGDVCEFKETALEVLHSLGFADRRSVKVTQAEFLKLLGSFNEAGINFGIARTA
ncbi:hypothetical protein L7F22_018083 [Adiantum nelumboides]|nr:hypothetical protein [Adiantum nelumboides]